MAEYLTDFDPNVLVSAIQANLQLTFPPLADMPGGRIHKTEDALWFSTGIQFFVYNMVLRTNVDADDPDDSIAGTIAAMADCKAPYLWLVSSSCRPDNLGQILRSHGLVHAEEEPGMAADLAALNTDGLYPPGLKIERVESRERMEQWVDVFAEGYGVPASARDAVMEAHVAFGLAEEPLWRHYLALLDDEPVGTSWSTLGAGVAGLYGVATIPKARRQGIGARISLAPMLDARDMGYRIGILQSSQMGLRVYRALGFTEYCIFNAYIGPPSQ